MQRLPFLAQDLDDELRERLSKVRFVMTDLDGTMISAGRATRDSSGHPSWELAKCLVELEEAGIEVVPVSGRNRSMTFEDAKILGLPAWIGEMGGLICTHQSGTPEWSYFTADMPYNPDSLKTPHDVICETGIVDEILETFAGRLETFHDNYVGFEYREVSVSLRGSAAPQEIEAVLAHCPLPLDVCDNGIVGKLSGPTTLVGQDPEHPHGVRSIHICPKGLSKGAGIKRFAVLRGIRKEQLLAAGDSPADCEMADAVGTFMLMSNGEGHPLTRQALIGKANVVVSAAPATDGWIAAMRLIMQVQREG